MVPGSPLSPFLRREPVNEATDSPHISCWEKKKERERDYLFIPLPWNVSRAGRKLYSVFHSNRKGEFRNGDYLCSCSLWKPKQRRVLKSFSVARMLLFLPNCCGKLLCYTVCLFGLWGVHRETSRVNRYQALPFSFYFLSGRAGMRLANNPRLFQGRCLESILVKKKLGHFVGTTEMTISIGVNSGIKVPTVQLLPKLSACMWCNLPTHVYHRTGVELVTSYSCISLFKLAPTMF